MAYTNLDALEYRARTLPNERIREAEHDHLVDELVRARPSTVRGKSVASIWRAGVRNLLAGLHLLDRRQPAHAGSSAAGHVIGVGLRS